MAAPTLLAGCYAPRDLTLVATSREPLTPGVTTARPVSQALLPAIDEPDRRRVDVIGVSCAQEVFAVLDNPQLSVGRIDEPADLVLGVGHRVHGVSGAMHPQDRTSDAVQPGVQAVPIAQIDTADPEPLPPRITGVVLLVCRMPECALPRSQVLAQALLKDGLHQLPRHPPLST